MPITTTVYAVTGTPVLVATGGADRISVTVNADAVGIFIGGPDVSALNGVPLQANAPLTLSLMPGDLLYAVGAGNLAVLRTRQ